jgi:hypothetical protein
MLTECALDSLYPGLSLLGSSWDPRGRDDPRDPSWWTSSFNQTSENFVVGLCRVQQQQQRPAFSCTLLPAADNYLCGPWGILNVQTRRYLDGPLSVTGRFAGFARERLDDGRQEYRCRHICTYADFASAHPHPHPPGYTRRRYVSTLAPIHKGMMG